MPPKFRVAKTFQKKSVNFQKKIRKKIVQSVQFLKKKSVQSIQFSKKTVKSVHLKKIRNRELEN